MLVNNGKNSPFLPFNPKKIRGKYFYNRLILTPLIKDLPAGWKVNLFLLPLDLNQPGPKGFQLEHLNCYLFT